MTSRNSVTGDIINSQVRQKRCKTSLKGCDLWPVMRYYVSLFHYMTKCSKVCTSEVASTQVEFEVGKVKLPLSLPGCSGVGSEIVKMHLAFLPAKLSLFLRQRRHRQSHCSS